MNRRWGQQYHQATGEVRQHWQRVDQQQQYIENFKAASYYHEKKEEQQEQQQRPSGEQCNKQ